MTFLAADTRFPQELVKHVFAVARVANQVLTDAEVTAAVESLPR